MPRFQDLTGVKFGRLTVIEQAGRDKNRSIKWKCRCECGNYTTVLGGNLRKGTSRSCGCLAKEIARERDSAENLTGRTFGRLTVLYRVENDSSGKPKWLCKCECGNMKAVSAKHLKHGDVKSCGCLPKEHAKTLHKINETHGKSNTRLYQVWEGMKQRCRPTSKNYGARGIKMCKEWENFEPFFEWAMSNGYDPGAKRLQCTLDRIDVNGDYCPENCRWIDNLSQQNNRQDNHKITFNGETHTLAEWSRILHMKNETLIARIERYGWSVEKALSIPTVSPHDKRRCAHGGTND